VQYRLVHVPCEGYSWGTRRCTTAYREVLFLPHVHNLNCEYK
jgi:hypothetical protein